MLVTTGLVYASISIINNYLLKRNSNQGILEAIDNGYIKEVDMKKVNSNGVNIKVKEILMDDFNLLILFNVELPELDSVDSISYIEFSNFVITDEQDNVIALTLENPEKYEEFYRQRNIETRTKNIAYNKGAYYSEIITKYDKNIEYKYWTYSENFPRSKKLNISFDKIKIYSKKTEENILVEGNWNIKVDLSENMYNRENVLYTVQSCNKDDIIVTKAQVSNTEMKLELTTKWGDPVFTEK